MRLYVETSAYDPEPGRRTTWEAGLVFDLRRGLHRPVVSGLVRRELARSTDEARSLFRSVEQHADAAEAGINETARRLATAFQERQILPAHSSAARLHVALAVSAGADALVTTSPELKRAERQFHTATVVAGHRPIPFRRPSDVARRRRRYAEAISNPLTQMTWSERQLNAIAVGFMMLNLVASRPGIPGRVMHWGIVGAIYLVLALAVVGAVATARWALGAV